MREHTADEARAMIASIHGWQQVFSRMLGRRMVFAADEYYLMADLPFPPAEHYEGFPMHEDGIGMARTFEMEFTGAVDQPTRPQSGFFAWVDGAPAEGYRAPRNPAADTGLRAATTAARLAPRRGAGVAVLTGEYGARVIAPLLAQVGAGSVRLLPVRNDFFGGNTSVTGLMVGADLARVLADQPHNDRYLLPDVCLSEGRFLDGLTVDDLPRPVEVVPTDGLSLRAALSLPPVSPMVEQRVAVEMGSASR
jgi:NifB/MoaA-like Fe-S oxidoreductase